jgi:hypothetical protein
MTNQNFAIYNGPPVPNHLALGLGPAGRKANVIHYQAELQRLRVREQELLVLIAQNTINKETL